jgi:hypothetical protein
MDMKSPWVATIAGDAEVDRAIATLAQIQERSKSP